MDKPSKNAISHVKPSEKGKRDVEEASEKLTSEKKQKIEVSVLTKQKEEKKKNVETSSSEESSDEEIVTKTSAPSKKFPAAAIKKDTKHASRERKESSESSDSDSSSDDELMKAAMVKKSAAAAPQKKSHSSDSSSECDSDEEKNADANKKPIEVGSKNKTESSGSLSGSELEEENKKLPVSEMKPAAVIKKADSSDGSSESDSDVDDKSSKKKSSVSVSKKQPESSDSSSESDSSEDDKDTDVVLKKDAPLVNTNDKTRSEKNVPKTPSQNQHSGSCTLFVGNLSFNAGRDEVWEFFQKAGEVVNVRLASSQDGRSLGFGHVEFASESDAQKALELNSQEFLGRAVKLDFARARGAYTPHAGKENKSYQKGGQTQGQTIFLKGFDKFLEEDQIRSSLKNHFGSCGRISRVSIPKDYETGASKGIAYIDFEDQNSFSQALELNGSDLGGYTIIVNEAWPRADNRDSGWSGGRGSGRGEDGGGRGSGRFGGHQGGRDGAGRGYGGGRGRGPSNRQSVGTASTGKKAIIIDDD